jgi:hypothetical protein
MYSLQEGWSMVCVSLKKEENNVFQFIKGIAKGTGWLILGILTVSLLNQEEIRYADMQQNGIKVTGEVVSVAYASHPRLNDRSKTDVYQTITVSYDVEGKNYVIDKKEMMSAVDGPPLEEGQKVNLFTEKDDPSKIQLERTDNGNFWAKASPWVGAIFIFTGLCYLVSSAFSFLLSFFKSSARKQ